MRSCWTLPSVILQVNLAAIVIFVLCISLAAYESALAAAFIVMLARRGQRPAGGQFPKAAILISLRGADPGLKEALLRLARQDYPDYQVHIVVDHRSDPAWPIVQEVLAESNGPEIFVGTLDRRLSTCSLKCSALSQMAGGLDESIGAVVLADADLDAHPTWLKELVAPLADPRVGAAFGNRWFLPATGRLGSVVRYLWNMGGVVAMSIMKTPWGGSLAIDGRAFRAGNVAEKWSRAIVDDAPVHRVMQEQKLRIAFVPGLMMVNGEECGLPFLFNFLVRQLLWTRTYVGIWWPPVVLATIVLALLPVAAIGVLLASLAGGNASAAGWSGGGIVLFTLAQLVLIALLEKSVQRVLADRMETPPRLPWRAAALLPLAMPLAFAIHLAATLTATFKRRVTWRGVTYVIRGPFDVEMLDYQPYAESARTAESNVSL